MPVKEINGVQITIMRKNGEWMVFPNKALLPLFVDWNTKDKIWKFKKGADENTARSLFKEFDRMQNDISDYIVEQEEKDYL